MVPLGAACLILALPVAAYAVVAALSGRNGDRRWIDSSRRAIYALCGLVTIAVIVLLAAFLRDDFSVELVADHSSTTTPVGYKMTAMWSSQAGSLLLWAWVLSIAASAVLYGTRRRHREIVPWATAVLGGLAVFFIGLMLFGLVSPGAESYPFSRLDPAPAEGVGLNPLLRHPAMAIHPPMLYSGYVLFSIPFAFAIGALVARRLDASWIRSTRRFALIAWTFLTIGVLLGARWSYSELGWGGYWGWDAVENASLMPWLLGTAFLHSVMVQERRGMLKVWNVSLIVATFTSACWGPSSCAPGCIESIHAFGVSKVGGPLLALIAVVLLGSVALIVSRLDDLQIGAPHRLAAVARVDLPRQQPAPRRALRGRLLGHVLPADLGGGHRHALVGRRAVLQPRRPAARDPSRALHRDRAAGRVAPALVGGGVAHLPLARRVAALVTLALVAFSDARGDPLSLALFACAAFSLAALVQEFAKAVSVRRALAGGSPPAALLAVVARNRRRYGGYIVHAGIAITFIAVAASSAFQTSRDLRLSPGDSATVGDYEVTYAEPTREIVSGEQRLTFGAVVEVTRDGEHVATLEPSRNYYSGMSDPALGPVAGFFEGETTSEVGRRDGLGGDVWVAMQPDLAPLRGDIREADERIMKLTRDLPPNDPESAGFASGLQGLAVGALAERYTSDPPPANFRVNVNPLVVWIWLGGAIAIGGALIALWPSPAARRRRVADVQAARLARDLGRAEI